jgi:hypothetical protein
VGVSSGTLSSWVVRYQTHGRNGLVPARPSWPAPWPVETGYVDFALSPEPAAARIALPYLVACSGASLPSDRWVRQG